jgi:hypothetical protein
MAFPTDGSRSGQLQIEREREAGRRIQAEDGWEKGLVPSLLSIASILGSSQQRFPRVRMGTVHFIFLMVEFCVI